MMEKLLKLFDFSDLNQLTRESCSGSKMSFIDILEDLLRGDFKGVFQTLGQELKENAFSGFSDSKNFLCNLLLLALISMLLRYLSLISKNKQVLDLTFYFVYFFLMLLLLDFFSPVFQIGQEVLLTQKEFMIALIPSYCLSLSLSVGASSATANYQLLLWTMSGLGFILEKLLLPLAKVYFFLGLMNGLDEKKRMQGFMQLLGKGISLGIRLCLMVALSLSTIENLMVSQVDGLQKTVVQKAVSAIPGIGDLSDSVTQVFLHSTQLIRNGVGISAIIILLFLCVNPLLRLWGISFVFRFTYALLNFLGLKKMATTILSLGECCGQILKICLCSMLMFLIEIAVTLGILGRTI